MNPSDQDQSAVDAPTTTNPVDLALERAHEDSVSPDVLRLLRKQERLIEAQTAQAGRERWRHIILMAIGTCVLGAIVALMWDASRARGVAIEPFRVPTEMAERGLDGAVVATLLMDQLLRMQDATESARAPSTYVNNWGEDIAVEIPNTGITIGDLRTSLRAWLGNQVRLSGEIVRRVDQTVELNVRVGVTAGQRFEGPESELHTLIERAAETVYEQTQPYRYTIWLRASGRAEEADRRVRDLAYGSNREDRLWALNSIAARTDDSNVSIPILEQGLRIDSAFTPILYNMVIKLSALGREQETWEYAKRFVAAKDRLREQVHPSRYPALVYEIEMITAQLDMDFAKRCKVGQELEQVSDRLTRMTLPLSVAGCHAMAHDVLAAYRVMEASGIDGRAREELKSQSPDLEVDSTIAEALEDWDAAYAALSEVQERRRQGPNDALFTDQSFLQISRLAVAAARTGRIDEARAMLEPTPLDCAFCVRARGTVAALAGDVGETQRWFESAQQLAAKLPATYAEHAIALLILEDWPGASRQAQLAARIAPRWADPKKYWGDALLEQNNPRTALARYREAERLAPNWGALKIAIGKAYAALGQEQLAQKVWEKAAQLPLSPRDRRELEELLAS